MMKSVSLAAVVATTLVSAQAAAQSNVGYYEMSLGQGSSTHVTPINTAGHTPVNLTTLSASSLANIDVLFVTNRSNVSYGSEYLSSRPAIEAWVRAGGVLVLHDRYVSFAESVLPGGGNFSIVRNFADRRNIDVLDDSTLVTNGPGGIVTDSTLDGGTSSSHGFAVLGSLPDSGTFMLSRGNSLEIVTFSYNYGAGAVVYSSIPLDYYLSGSGPTTVSRNMRTIYAPNVIAYAATLGDPCASYAGLGDVISVDAGGNSTVFGTIQNALDAAENDGTETIFVNARTYTEDVLIQRQNDLELRACGDVFIDRLQIKESRNVSVHGFNIINRGLFDVGLFLWGAADGTSASENVTVEQSSVSGFDYGVRIDPGNINAQFIDISITDSSNTGIVTYDYGQGNQSSVSFVDCNVVRSQFHGATLGPDVTVLFDGCDISNNGKAAISVPVAGHPGLITIRNNTFSQNNFPYQWHAPGYADANFENLAAIFDVTDAQVGY